MTTKKYLSAAFNTLNLMPHPDGAKRCNFHGNLPFLRSNTAICVCCITTSANFTFFYRNDNCTFPIAITASYCSLNQMNRKRPRKMTSCDSVHFPRKSATVTPDYTYTYPVSMSRRHSGTILYLLLHDAVRQSTAYIGDCSGFFYSEVLFLEKGFYCRF